MTTEAATDDDLVRDAVERMLAQEVNAAVLADVDRGVWPRDLWQACEDSGLDLALLNEEDGGAGMGPAVALAVAELSGYHAAPVPLADTLLARAAFGAHESLQADSRGAIAIAAFDSPLKAMPRGDGVVLSGRLRDVAWPRHVISILVAFELEGASQLALLDSRQIEWRADASLTGEPRGCARLHVHAVSRADYRACDPGDIERLHAQAAALRAAQICGGMRRCLALTVDYTTQRSQFGKSIGAFQAVQQQLAQAAGQLSSAQAALGLAAGHWSGALAGLGCAVAKARAGAAARIVTATSHQVHGAIGYTQEHTLHRFTRRIWQWGDDFGGEAFWQARIGQEACAAGGDGLWGLLTQL